MGNTSILIRAQALGGKFIGSDINGYFLTVLDEHGHALIPQQPFNGNSGAAPAPWPQPGASVATVLTQRGSPDPTPSWIIPEGGTVGALVTFDLDGPTWIEVIVNGVKMNGKTPVPNQHEGRVRMLVPKGAQLTSDPGLVVIVPGLAVTITDLRTSGPEVLINALVTMMCGCKINIGSPWPPEEFEVWALFSRDSEPPVPVRLSFKGSSTFGTTVALAPKGTYDVWVTAVQPGIGNTGGAKGSFTLS